MNKLRFFTHAGGKLRISQAKFLSDIRPLDAVGVSARDPLAEFIRFWTNLGRGLNTSTHFEQVMAPAPSPVDLSAEKPGLIPRQFMRLLGRQDSRGEIWRCRAEGTITEGVAAELLARWAAKFYGGYSLAGAVLSADRAAELLGSVRPPIGRVSTWCSQSVFQFCRSLGSDWEIDPAHDPDADGVDPAELQDMLGRSENWRKVLSWDSRGK